MGIVAARIEGGFLAIDVAELVHAWRSCQARGLGIGDFRAWLAAREMTARRQGTRKPHTSFYAVAELAGLNGTTARTAAASVRRLVAAGLLAWSEEAIGFPPSTSGGVVSTDTLGDTISGGQGPVAIPRRLLRWLASGARPALVATALGALLRCVSRRKAGFGVRGRFKASWVASLFGIAERHVRSARAELLTLGWLQVDPADSGGQWAWNRWGRAFLVCLDWRAPRGDRPTLLSDPGARSSYPDQTPIPSRRNSNPEPGEPGPSGASLSKKESSQPAPTLHDIKPADLVDVDRTQELYRQALKSGRISASERDRVRFHAAVEHARTVGRSNPPGLLARIVRDGLWNVINQGDEDRATRRLREPQRPVLAAILKPAPPPTSSPKYRSPYGAECPAQETSNLGSLLERLATRNWNSDS